MKHSAKQAESASSTRRTLRGRPPLGEAQRITEHVMRVGLAMFLDRGFAHTTIDAIAAKARISKATFYSRFSSKQALLEACLADFAVRKNPQHLSAETMQLPFEERLNRLTDHILDLILAEETIKLERLATAESYRFPQIARLANKDGTDRALAVVRAVLDDAVMRGDLLPCDTGLLSQMLMDLLFGFLRRSVQGLIPASERPGIWKQMHDTNALMFRGQTGRSADDAASGSMGDRRGRVAGAAADHPG